MQTDLQKATPFVGGGCEALCVKQNMGKIKNGVGMELRRCEEDLWRPETRFDRELMEKVLADDFFEIGQSGRIWSREELLNTIGVEINAVIPLENFAIRKLAKDIYQVTYNSHVEYDGVIRHGRRSSIWMRSPSRWKLLFHQGTPYEINA